MEESGLSSVESEEEVPREPMIDSGAAVTVDRARRISDLLAACQREVRTATIFLYIFGLVRSVR